MAHIGKKTLRPQDTIYVGGATDGGHMARGNLKQARKAANLTQKNVADRLGITERYYRMIEAGDCTGGFEIWDDLEDMFGISQRVLRQCDRRASQG